MIISWRRILTIAAHILYFFERRNFTIIRITIIKIRRLWDFLMETMTGKIVSLLKWYSPYLYPSIGTMRSRYNTVHFLEITVLAGRFFFKPDLRCTFVTFVLYAISCYIWPCHNGNRLYSDVRVQTSKPNLARTTFTLNRGCFVLAMSLFATSTCVVYAVLW